MLGLCDPASGHFHRAGRWPSKEVQFALSPSMYPLASLDKSVCWGHKPQKADGMVVLGYAFLEDEMMGPEVSA